MAVTTRAALLGAALAGVLMGGGCAQLGGQDAGGPEQAGPSEEDAVEFARCMRDNGIDMPDPGDDGAMLPLKAGDEDTEKALEECQDLLPEAEDGRSEEEVHKENLETAECLREQGIDVEDPKKGEGLAIPADDEEEVRAAFEECDPDGGRTAVTEERP